MIEKKNLNLNIKLPFTFSLNDEDDGKDLEDSVKMVTSSIEKELKTTGIPQTMYVGKILKMIHDKLSNDDMYQIWYVELEINFFTPVVGEELIGTIFDVHEKGVFIEYSPFNNKNSILANQKPAICFCKSFTLKKFGPYGKGDAIAFKVENFRIGNNEKKII
eukprot:Pgem_evm3s4547